MRLCSCWAEVSLRRVVRLLGLLTPLVLVVSLTIGGSHDPQGGDRSAVQLLTASVAVKNSRDLDRYVAARLRLGLAWRRVDHDLQVRIAALNRQRDDLSRMRDANGEAAYVDREIDRTLQRLSLQMLIARRVAYQARVAATVAFLQDIQPQGPGQAMWT